MSRDIDDLSLYDRITDERGYFMPSWQEQMASFVLTLQEYLSGNGIYVPRLTTTERDALQGVTNGQLIYNTTTDKFQGYEAGAWTNLI